MPQKTLPEQENPRWTIRAYRPGDEDQLVALFARVFAKSISIAHWQWKLKAHPFPVENVWLAVEADAGRPIFQYAGIPWRYQLSSEEVTGIVSVDTMADPDFRRQGLLTKVGRFTYDQWRNAGVNFIIGLPNEKWGSRAEALGWQVLFPLQWLVRPLNPLTLLAKQIRLHHLQHLRIGTRLWQGFWRRRFPPDPTVTVSPITQAGPEFDQLWLHCAGNGLASIIRDATWVNWRYLQAPVFSFQVLLARRQGQPVGYLAYRLDEINNRRVGLVVDLLAAGKDIGVQATLIDRAVTEMAAAGAESAVAQASPNTWMAAALRKAGFFVRNKSFTVQLVPLAANCPIEMLRQPHNWHISGGDFDII